MRERTSRNMREVVLKNTGVGKAIDLRRRAQVDHLDVPAEAGEPGLDARGGVLADVGDLGVPGGLVLALAPQKYSRGCKARSKDPDTRTERESREIL